MQSKSAVTGVYYAHERKTYRHPAAMKAAAEAWNSGDFDEDLRAHAISWFKKHKAKELKEKA